MKKDEHKNRCPLFQGILRASRNEAYARSDESRSIQKELNSWIPCGASIRPVVRRS